MCSYVIYKIIEKRKETDFYDYVIMIAGIWYIQGTKKFRSDSPGLVEFILHLPDGQVKVSGTFFVEIN